MIFLLIQLQGKQKAQLQLIILDVWNHFKRQKIDGNWRVVCNYLEKKLLGDGRQGISHL